jgi:hypothetical protein
MLCTTHAGCTIKERYAWDGSYFSRREALPIWQVKTASKASKLLSLTTAKSIIFAIQGF